MPRAKTKMVTEEEMMHHAEMEPVYDMSGNEEKGMWRSFNPTLKEMLGKNPDLSVLGLWWAWYWRLACLAIGVCVVFGLIVWIVTLAFGH